jgi:predicted RNase H-like HicB family nuclease
MQLTIRLPRETDGRWIADIPELPGVTVCGVTSEEATVRAKALALRVIAEEIEHGRCRPEPTRCGSPWPHERMAPRPLEALTVVPFGMEEGTETRIPGPEFGLLAGAPAEFRFFTSTVRKDDRPGDLIEDFGDELQKISPNGSELPSAIVCSSPWHSFRGVRRGPAGVLAAVGHRP